MPLHVIFNISASSLKCYTCISTTFKGQACNENPHDKKFERSCDVPLDYNELKKMFDEIKKIKNTTIPNLDDVLGKLPFSTKNSRQGMLIVDFVQFRGRFFAFDICILNLVYVKILYPIIIKIC